MGERRRGRQRAPAVACRERQSGTSALRRAGSRKLGLPVVLDRALRAACGPLLPGTLLLGAIRGDLVDRFDDDANAAAFEAGNGLVQLDEFAVNDSSNRSSHEIMIARSRASAELCGRMPRSNAGRMT